MRSRADMPKLALTTQPGVCRVDALTAVWSSARLRMGRASGRPTFHSCSRLVENSRELAFATAARSGHSPRQPCFAASSFMAGDQPQGMKLTSWGTFDACVTNCTSGRPMAARCCRKVGVGRFFGPDQVSRLGNCDKRVRQVGIDGEYRRRQGLRLGADELVLELEISVQQIHGSVLRSVTVAARPFARDFFRTAVPGDSGANSSARRPRFPHGRYRPQET